MLHPVPKKTHTCFASNLMRKFININFFSRVLVDWLMVASYAIASVASNEKRFIALLNPQLVSVICLEIDETIIKFMCVIWLKKTIFGVMFSLKGNFKWDLKRYWFLRRCPSHTVWACQNHRKNRVPRCCASFFGCINKNQLNLTSKSDEPKKKNCGQKKLP